MQATVNKQPSLRQAGLRVSKAHRVQPKVVAQAAVSGCPFRKQGEIVKVAVNEQLLRAQGTEGWPTWGCDVSKFSWTYDGDEEAYILMGTVIVTPDGGKPVTIKAGDYVVFPAGMSCTWDVKEPISKHYRLYD